MPPYSACQPMPPPREARTAATNRNAEPEEQRPPARPERLAERLDRARQRERREERARRTGRRCSGEDPVRRSTRGPPREPRRRRDAGSRAASARPAGAPRRRRGTPIQGRPGRRSSSGPHRQPRRGARAPPACPDRSSVPPPVPVPALSSWAGRPGWPGSPIRARVYDATGRPLLGRTRSAAESPRRHPPERASRAPW